MALRAVALGYPLVVFPALLVLFPARAGEAFRERWAIFAGRSWEDLKLLGVSPFMLWVGAFSALVLSLARRSLTWASFNP